MAVTQKNIQTTLGSSVYRSLCGAGTQQQQDSYCQSAIDTAIIHVTAELKKYKIEYDNTKAVIKQAVTLYTIYELYSRVENEDIAQDKKQQANELLANTYAGGEQSTASTTAGSSSLPTGTPNRQPIASVKTGSSIRKKVFGRQHVS